MPTTMEKSLRERLTLDFTAYDIAPAAEDFDRFYSTHPLFEKAKVEWAVLGELFTLLQPLPAVTYFPTLLADFIREQLLQDGASFVFETVMSDTGKIDLLKRAQEKGYRTYLYYICIDDPLVNVDRVADRVTKAGHSVPTDKILDRYNRSLANSLTALQYTNRAYYWDNSGTSHKYLAEITDATEVDLAVDAIPYWFEEQILNKR